MSDDEIRLTTHRVPVLDTGIGQEMGYEDDKAFLAAMEEERAQLPAEVRERLEALEAEMQRRVLGL